VATSEAELQELVDGLDRVSRNYSLLINIMMTYTGCTFLTELHVGEEGHARPGWTTSRRGQDSRWKSQSEWQRTGITGESTSMVWPTVGSRTAKEQNRTEQIIISIPSPSVFHSRLKAFFLLIFPTIAFFFFFRSDSPNSPDCLPILTEHIRFLLFGFSVFPFFSCWFRAVD